ncbi:PHD finger protein 23-like [Lycorma delicatula]|uniref:PHD finger protein 23-like n=1 Tax=Lycorma delicatula TaxID=130591 RepID=UPI003F513E79
MSDAVVKGETCSNGHQETNTDVGSATKRPRTSEDFYLFCKFVLEYVKYDGDKTEDERDSSASPMGSTGSVNEDEFKYDAISDNSQEEQIEISSDDESYDVITCYCRKPFAGRPMIECSSCLKWIHFSCAKLKRSNIPKVFICIECKQRTNIHIDSNQNTSSA